MDRIMIDPAYKMERMSEAYEKVYTMSEAWSAVDEQLVGMSMELKTPVGRDIYESWLNIEKSIMKFDRMFNKVEKFNARAMTDVGNHERREKRMLSEKNKRWVDNYTYFYNGLTEEEQ